MSHDDYISIVFALGVVAGALLEKCRAWFERWGESHSVKLRDFLQRLSR